MEESEQLVERHKRRRELATVFLLAVIFLVLTAIEYKLFGMSQQLRFETSIFFLGLVNFNIILFLLLFFLIFRNVVKIFSERRDGLAGNTLKAKLIAAFVLFSFVPTALMFLVSVFYINNSFDRWFSDKMAGVLKSSLEVTNAYYLSAKRKNYHSPSRSPRSCGMCPAMHGRSGWSNCASAIVWTRSSIILRSSVSGSLVWARKRLCRTSRRSRSSCLNAESRIAMSLPPSTGSRTEIWF
ncbi:MAG: hypothetical protein HC902_15000, partial [Calothrix sp. SM1_5_4]|nr:hypothetical protein [Calothrix sp. SM1_5_4]